MRFPHAIAPGLAAAFLAVWSLCASAEPRTTRLRITLGAEEPVAWRGELRLSRGVLAQRRPLSLDPEAAAATWIDGGVLRIDHRTPRRLDALDVTAAAEAGASLELRLTDEAGEPLTSAAIDLQAARDQPQAFALGDTGRWIRVERPDVDRLRLTTPLDSLVRRPGEELDLRLRVEPKGLERGDAVDLTATLSRGRSGEPVWRGEAMRLGIDDDAGANAAVTVPLPREEGVYTVTLAASEPSGYRNRFMPLHKPARLLERRWQVLVVDRSTRPPEPTDWSEAYAYDPRTQSWADRAPRWFGLRRLPWFADGPASNVPEATRHVDRTRAIRLPASATPGDANWVAYPLPVSRPGEPHAVEIDQLGEPGSRLAVALLEPDALGDLRPVGVATSHALPRWNASNGPHRVRLLIHPRTNAPLLIVANPSTRSATDYGAIRLYRLRGDRVPATPAAASARGREVKLLVEASDLPHTLGASHAASRSGEHEVADLQTLWETARRLADRVEAAGAGGAAIRVNGDGSALYRSTLWTTVRNDLGVWDDASADAPRPALLPLVAIEFERRRLRLTPIIAADAAAPGERDADFGSLAARAAGEVRQTLGGFAGLDRIAVRRGAAAFDADPAVWQSLGDHARTQSSPLLLPAIGLRRGDRPSAVALLAASDAGWTIARPHGVAPPPGVTTAAAEESFCAELRATLPNLSGAPIAYREPIDSLRLIESGLRLRRPDGVRSTDVRLPLVPTDSEALASLLVDSAPVAGGFYLGGGAAAGVIDDPTRDAVRSQGATDVAAQRVGSDADVDAWLTPPSDGERRLVVANRTRWRREATVTVAVSDRCLLEQVSEASSTASAEWLTPGRHALRVTFEPGEMRRWRAYSTRIEVAGVAVRPSKAGQRELAAAIATLRERDTATRQPTDRVANGSFEQPDASGEAASDWTTRGAVDRVSGDAESGVASLRMRSTAAQRATAAGAPFRTPATGRLVVRLAVKTESAGDDALLG
ncbi:MAG: hypothetical protein AAF805_07810, partial [Planctomycetota bacterium]